MFKKKDRSSIYNEYLTTDKIKQDLKNHAIKSSGYMFIARILPSHM